MKTIALVFSCVWLAGGATVAQRSDEQLHYSINWPSGLSLGEGDLHVKTSPSGSLQSELTIEASVPGFAVLDRFRSLQKGDGFCSTEFDKNLSHGRKRSEEKVTFHAQNGTATRETKGGGTSEVTTGACGRDPLALLSYLRGELRSGRLPSTQTVVFGAPYRVRLEFGGSQMLNVGEARFDADRILVFLKGPASDTSFEIYFSKDAARIPLLVKVPFPLGTISMELAR